MEENTFGSLIVLVIVSTEFLLIFLRYYNRYSLCKTLNYEHFLR